MFLYQTLYENTTYFLCTMPGCDIQRCLVNPAYHTTPHQMQAWKFLLPSVHLQRHQADLVYQRLPGRTNNCRHHNIRQSSVTSVPCLHVLPWVHYLLSHPTNFNQVIIWVLLEYTLEINACTEVITTAPCVNCPWWLALAFRCHYYTKRVVRLFQKTSRRVSSTQLVHTSWFLVN